MLPRVRPYPSGDKTGVKKSAISDILRKIAFLKPVVRLVSRQKMLKGWMERANYVAGSAAASIAAASTAAMAAASEASQSRGRKSREEDMPVSSFAPVPTTGFASSGDDSASPVSSKTRTEQRCPFFACFSNVGASNSLARTRLSLAFHRVELFESALMQAQLNEAAVQTLAFQGRSFFSSALHIFSFF